MQPFYGSDLAYIQATEFGKFAEGAAPDIIRRLKAAPIPIRRVVDVGCGAGPLTAALIAAGFDVTGIDISADLLAMARKVAPSARFIHVSVYDTAFPESDAVVALGEPLTYHDPPAAGDAKVAHFFHRVSQSLPLGGLLIFDIIELGEPSLNGRYWNSGEDWAVLAETTEDRNSRTLIRRIQTFRRIGDSYHRGTEIHQIRLFAPPELVNQLVGSGFSVQTATSYGTQVLPPRRRAFFCTRLPRS